MLSYIVRGKEDSNLCTPARVFKLENGFIRFINTVILVKFLERPYFVQNKFQELASLYYEKISSAVTQTLTLYPKSSSKLDDLTFNDEKLF